MWARQRTTSWYEPGRSRPFFRALRQWLRRGGWQFREQVKETSKLCSAPVLTAGTLDGGPFRDHRYVVALCVTTFKRNFQAQASLPVSLALTWPQRDTFFWCVVDFNKDLSLIHI